MFEGSRDVERVGLGSAVDNVKVKELLYKSHAIFCEHQSRCVG